MRRGYNRPATSDDDAARAKAAELKSYLGITFWLKASPVLEEFVKSMGTGELKPVNSFGRQWVELPGYEGLLIHDVNVHQQDVPGVTIQAPGQALRLPNPNVPGGY